MLGADIQRILAGMVKCDLERRATRSETSTLGVLAMMGSCLACGEQGVLCMG